MSAWPAGAARRPGDRPGAPATGGCGGGNAERLDPGNGSQGGRPARHARLPNKAGAQGNAAQPDAAWTDLRRNWLRRVNARPKACTVTLPQAPTGILWHKTRRTVKSRRSGMGGTIRHAVPVGGCLRPLPRHRQTRGRPLPLNRMLGFAGLRSPQAGSSARTQGTACRRAGTCARGTARDGAGPRVQGGPAVMRARARHVDVLAPSWPRLPASEGRPARACRNSYNYGTLVGKACTGTQTPLRRDLALTLHTWRGAKGSFAHLTICCRA